MKRKHYFWNRKHHRELDEKMGLLKPMSEPMAKLAEACGMDTRFGGTEGVHPFTFLTIDQVIRKSFGKVEDMIIYNYFSNERPHRLYRSKHFDLARIDDGEIDQDGRDRMGFKRR